MAKQKFQAGQCYGRREENGRLFPLTKAMIERRDKIANALGYTKRNPCSLSLAPQQPNEPPGGEFECWEWTEMKWRPKWKPDVAISGFHHVHRHDDKRFNAAHPGVELSWPEDVQAAAWAIDKGKPLPGDPKDDASKPATMAQIAIPGT
jgi:hypothetical protein